MTCGHTKYEGKEPCGCDNQEGESEYPKGPVPRPEEE